MVDTFYTNFNGQLQPKSRLPEKKRELCKKFSINGFGGGETNQRLEKKKENKKKNWRYYTFGSSKRLITTTQFNTILTQF